MFSLTDIKTIGSFYHDSIYINVFFAQTDVVACKATREVQLCSGCLIAPKRDVDQINVFPKGNRP